MAQNTAIMTATVAVEYDPETRRPQDGLQEYMACNDIAPAFEVREIFDADGAPVGGGVSD